MKSFFGSQRDVFIHEWYAHCALRKQTKTKLTNPQCVVWIRYDFRGLIAIFRPSRTSNRTKPVKFEFSSYKSWGLRYNMGSLSIHTVVVSAKSLSSSLSLEIRIRASFSCGLYWPQKLVFEDLVHTIHGGALRSVERLTVCCHNAGLTENCCRLNFIPFDLESWKLHLESYSRNVENFLVLH